MDLTCDMTSQIQRRALRTGLPRPGPSAAYHPSSGARERLHFGRSSSIKAPTRAWRSKHRASSQLKDEGWCDSSLFVTPPERRATHPFIFRTSGTQTRRTVFLDDTPSNHAVVGGRLKCSPPSHETTSSHHLLTP